MGIHGTSCAEIVGNVVGTERHHGLEKGQKLPGETVHTNTVNKLGGVTNVLLNVRVRFDTARERSHDLKSVQSGSEDSP